MKILMLDIKDMARTDEFKQYGRIIATDPDYNRIAVECFSSHVQFIESHALVSRCVDITEEVMNGLPK